MVDFLASPDNELYLIDGDLVEYDDAVAVVLPTVLVAAATGNEGGTISIPIRIDRAFSLAVLVDYTMADGTAVSGIDYSAAAGTATIPAGSTEVLVPVVTTLRPGDQSARTFSITIRNARTSTPTSLTITTATQTITILDTETVVAANAYFDALKVLPECVDSWSLREGQAQINALVETGAVAHSFQYVYPNDTLYQGDTLSLGATPKDGVRLYHDNTLDGPGWDGTIDPVSYPAGLPWHQPKNIPRDECLKFPLGYNTAGDTVIVIVDSWYDAGWRLNRVDYTREYKPFRFRFSGDGTFWSCNQVGFGSIDGHWGTLKSLLAASDWNGVNRPLGLLEKDPVKPTGLEAAVARTAHMPYGQWVRHVFEIRLYQPPAAFTNWCTHVGIGALNANAADAQGRWHMVSSWDMGETYDARRLLFQVPFFTNSGSPIVDFVFNMHTSMGGPGEPPNQTGPLVAYFRNLVVLLNYTLPATPENDTTIFARPVA